MRVAEIIHKESAINTYALCKRGTIFILALLLMACAPKELFYWGDYEDTLYQRYLDNKSDTVATELKKSMDDASHEQMRIAPGVYADYGFMLYLRGDKAGAIAAFKQESTLYPESATLMTKLVEKIQKRTKSMQSKGGLK